MVGPRIRLVVTTAFAATVGPAAVVSSPSPSAEAVAASLRVLETTSWREHGREAFKELLVALGCLDCATLTDSGGDFSLASQHFGCADIDVLLPSLHWLYENSRRRLGEVPSLWVDGGANIGRVTARWISTLGDGFGRRMSKNATKAPGIICAGIGGGAAWAASAPPNAVVVSVEPSERNFAQLREHADAYGWSDDGWIGIKAALGAVSGSGNLAINAGFAVDEVATLVFEDLEDRVTQPVRVVTLKEVVEAARYVFSGIGDVGAEGIFMLKLDIEGLEPAVLRSLEIGDVSVKFVSFEYSAGTWRESIPEVLASLSRAGYFCFMVTSQRLFPVSGPFWDTIYEMPSWSNFFCGQLDDDDLDAIVRLHAGSVGMWPMLPGTYLPDYAEDNPQSYSLWQAQHRCTDLGNACLGVTCSCPGGSCHRHKQDRGAAMGACTLRKGEGGMRLSPDHEVTFLRDPIAADLYLRYRAAWLVVGQDGQGRERL